MSRARKTGVDGMKEGTHAKRILNLRSLWAQNKFRWKKQNCPTFFAAADPNDPDNRINFEIKRDYGKDTILISVKDENFIWREDY